MIFASGGVPEAIAGNVGWSNTSDFVGFLRNISAFSTIGEIVNISLAKLYPDPRLTEVHRPILHRKG